MGRVIELKTAVPGPASDALMARRARAVTPALARGLVPLSAGTDGNVVRVPVPLTADDALVDEGLDVIAEALRASRLAPH